MSDPRTTPRTRWLREPLLHFLLIGAIVFIADALLHRNGDAAHTIIVSADVAAETRTMFEKSRGRAPDAAELKALSAAWLDNEVLYREGLAMQVDKGDSAIRERVIFKALSVIDASVKLPEADDATLRAWFEAHREKYDEPKRYDFEEAVLSGEATEATVREFVNRLNSGTPGDVQAGLRVFKGRPLSNLVQSYGEDFPKLLGDAASPEWRALNTRDGWRAMRVDAVNTGKTADFDTLRVAILQDWKDAIAAEQRSAAVHRLAQKYSVRFAPASDDDP